MKETDLYGPVKKHFELLGFTVRSEVRGCDLAAFKGEELVIVELKLDFNIKLLYQALERQKLTNSVYVAIPRPKRSNSLEFRSKVEIARRMKIGLIVVGLDSPAKCVEEVVLPPGGDEKNSARRNGEKRAKVLKEAAGRRGDYNQGGSSRVKINTVYREKAIKIACALEKSGPMASPALIKRYGCDKNSYRIMKSDYYGWFSNLGKGVFLLNDAGKAFLEEFAEQGIVAFCKGEVEEADNPKEQA
ncbi:MAG: DUF2161 family putative PD-(D/E)XK-type phosphodiesterase [Clostridiales bacterium]|jgi:hypothetical protein|nr:DUF2161 family putative PD-(D/E)XK-type phosphodiesterase [Clostridiales bacterium]